MAQTTLKEIARGYPTNECSRNSYAVYKINNREYKFKGSEKEINNQLQDAIILEGNHKTYEIGSQTKTYYSKDGNIDRQLQRDISTGGGPNLKQTTFTYDYGNRTKTVTYTDFENNKKAQSQHAKNVTNGKKAQRRYAKEKRVKTKSREQIVIKRVDSPGKTRPQIKEIKEPKQEYEAKAKRAVRYKKIREVIFEITCVYKSFIYAKRKKSTKSKKGKKAFHSESCDFTPKPRRLCWCVNRAKKSEIMAAINVRMSAGTIPLENQVFESAKDVSNAEVSRDNVTARRGDYMVIWIDKCP